MVNVPWPTSNSPGVKSQEGAGRMINVFPELRGEGVGIVWRRAPGAVVFARAPSVGAAVIDFNAQGISSVVEIAGSAVIEIVASGIGGTA